jgi:hypothetical protein
MTCKATLHWDGHVPRIHVNGDHAVLIFGARHERDLRDRMSSMQSCRSLARRIGVDPDLCREGGKLPAYRRVER